MREVLKLALEALKQIDEAMPFPVAKLAIMEAEKALAQPDQLFEENERLHVENRRLIERIETIGVPVGVGGFVTTTTQPEQEPDDLTIAYMSGYHDGKKAQRTWVWLTDEEFQYCVELKNPESIAEEVEAKLKEKNT